MIFEPMKIKSDTDSTFSLSTCHEMMGLDTMILVFFFLINIKFQASFFTLLFHPQQEAI